MNKKKQKWQQSTVLSVLMVHLFECIIQHICLPFLNNIVAFMLSIMLDMSLLLILVSFVKHGAYSFKNHIKK